MSVIVPESGCDPAEQLAPCRNAITDPPNHARLMLKTFRSFSHPIPCVRWQRGPWRRRVVGTEFPATSMAGRRCGWLQLKQRQRRTALKAVLRVSAHDRADRLDHAGGCGDTDAVLNH
jgi:hypothetical protein